MSLQILTDEDFQKIKERRQQREAEKLAGLKPGQRPIADSDEEEYGPFFASQL